MFKKSWILLFVIVLALSIACGSSSSGVSEPARERETTYQDEPVRFGTGVYFNGYELQPGELRDFERLLGHIPPGQYWLDNQGNYGRQGEWAMGNLNDLARQHSERTGNDDIMLIGKCTIASDGVVC